MEIHAIRGRRANSYLIEEQDRLMVIDVPFLGDGAVLRYLSEHLGRSPYDVDQILCTHGHGDHMGGIAALAATCGAQVFIPPLTRRWRQQFLPSPARIWARLRTPANPPAAPRLLEHGGAIPGFPGWQVIHTPGHTEDSCCFFHATSGSLVSGDTILGSGRTGRLVLPAIYRDRDRLHESVRALNALRPTAVYPGHGTHLEGIGLLAELAGALDPVQ